MIKSPGFRHQKIVQGGNLLPVTSLYKQGNTIIAGTTAGRFCTFKKTEQCNQLPGLTMLRELHQVSMEELPMEQLIKFSYTSTTDIPLWKISAHQTIKSVYRSGTGMLLSSSRCTFIRSAEELTRANSKKNVFHFRDSIIRIGRSTVALTMGSKLYIGDITGLYSSSPVNSRLTVSHIPIIKSHISCLARQDSGILWIGTYDKGLYCYRGGKIIAHITEDSGGLSNNACRSLYIYNKETWCGTSRGVNCIVQQNGVYRVSSPVTSSCNANADIIDAVMVDGNTVYLGTPDGIIYFDKRRIRQHSISRIKVTAVEVSGKQLPLNQPDYYLPQTDHNIRFEFSGISFLSDNSINYKYRLLGAGDDTWKHTRNNVLDFHFLPSGDYRLQLIAVNKFGDESTTWEKAFHIAPSLTERPLFWAATGIFFVSALYWLIRRRIKHIHKMEDLKSSYNTRIMELEQMALRAQMNPHFIFNCMNSVQRYILKMDVAGANDYLANFAGLIRQTLENAPHVYIRLDTEIDYLATYIRLEQSHCNVPFSFTITVDPAIERRLVKIPNMVLQPFVENAIKHGVAEMKQKGMLQILFKKGRIGNYLECKIIDNGPGINYSVHKKNGPKKQVSQGVQITNRRIDILNKLQKSERRIEISTRDDSFDNKPGTGTTIHIIFPL